MKSISVKDIYTGKPDARDEVGYSSLEEFCDRVILPPKFELNNILHGDSFYVVGNKGVGKTALLLYIKQQLMKEDEDAVCSMILFKTDYSSVERAQLDKFQRELISSLSIDEHELVNIRDFSKIWTLLIYQKIVNDNEESGYKIFENDTNWKSFAKIITALNNEKRKILKLTTTIPKEIVTVYDDERDVYISQERLNYPDNEESVSLGEFYYVVEFADKLFQSLTMCSHRYFLCIDELEAYHSERNIFERDLSMIRDLIITTKRINDLTLNNKRNAFKIVLSVRSEMVRSIYNEIAGREFNKCLDGFAEKINWSDGQGLGIHQPLFYVWLRRIALSVGYSDEIKYEEIYENWFPATVGVENTVDFLLKRTWYKPRDIVRFMNILKKLGNDSDLRYCEQNIVQALAQYSSESLTELTEELNGTYNSKDIASIIKSLTAFKKKFTKQEYREYLENLGERKMVEDVDGILSNLYRVGIIGCINNDGIERWHYRNAVTPIEGKDWEYIVHRGLWDELQLQKDSYDGIPLIDIQGKPILCRITEYGKTKLYYYLQFEWNGKMKRGKIHVKNLTGKYIEDKDAYKGKELNLFVIDYDIRHHSWEFSYDVYQGYMM